MSQAIIALAIITLTMITSCSSQTTDSAAADKAQTAVLLKRFDNLDFDIYSNQKWDSLQVSHAENVLVHYPDGSTTKGLHDHIEALKPMFVFAPDTRITEHPVKFGIEGWTSVIGVLTGTFTKPMPIGGGKTIPPTGKKFTLKMSTVAKWENGKITEEYLFWDNQSFLKQVGLAQ